MKFSLCLFAPFCTRCSFSCISTILWLPVMFSPNLESEKSGLSYTHKLRMYMNRVHVYVTSNTNDYSVLLWSALLYNAQRGCPLFCVYTHSPTFHRIWFWWTGYKLTEVHYIHTYITYWSDTQIQYCIQYHRKKQKLR